MVDRYELKYDMAIIKANNMVGETGYQYSSYRYFCLRNSFLILILSQ